MWTPVKKETIARDSKIVDGHMLVDEKVDAENRFVKVKARFVADDSKSKTSSSAKSSSPSPTMHSSSFHMMLAISAYERRSMCTFDVPTAFTWAPIPDSDLIYLRMRRQVVDILLRLRPDYAQYVNADGSIYFKLERALYGLVQSALLWYIHLSNTLTALKYVKCHFDPCIFVKTTSSSTIMVGMHVDDGFASEKFAGTSTPLQDELLSRLNKAYPGLKSTRGTELEYTKIRVLQDKSAGAITIDQVGYVEKLLLKHKITKGAATPMTHTQRTQGDEEKIALLSQEATSQYKSLVMELNHLAIHTRPDIALAVSMAATKMQRPSSRDEQSLLRILQYLCSTHGQRMLIQPLSLQLFMWIDASYACHDDAKSQTGMVASLGLRNGVVMTKSSKQQLLAASTAVAELIALNSGVVYLQYMRGLLKELGYEQVTTTVFQDNKSTIVMAEKGSGSFKNSKHLAVRHFAVKEQIDDKSITLKHIGTNDMLIADGLTKPLIGSTFMNFRTLLMGK